MDAEEGSGREEAWHWRQRVGQRAQGAILGGAAVAGELPEGAQVAAVITAAAVALRVRGGLTGANVNLVRLARHGRGPGGKRGEAGRESVEDYA